MWAPHDAHDKSTLNICRGPKFISSKLIFGSQSDLGLTKFDLSLMGHLGTLRDAVAQFVTIIPEIRTFVNRATKHEGGPQRHHENRESYGPPIQIEH